MYLENINNEYFLKENDSLTEVHLRVLTENGEPVDLTKFSIIDVVIGVDEGRIATKTPTLANEQGELHFQLDVGDLYEYGDNYLEVHLYQGNNRNSRKHNVPSKGYYKLRIQKPIDGMVQEVTTYTLDYFMGQVDDIANNLQGNINSALDTLSGWEFVSHWDPTVRYRPFNVVEYLGSAWQAKRANINKPPVEGPDWILIASRGERGPYGMAAPFEHEATLSSGQTSLYFEDLSSDLDSDIMHIYIGGTVIPSSLYRTVQESTGFTVTFLDAPFDDDYLINIKGLRAVTNSELGGITGWRTTESWSATKTYNKNNTVTHNGSTWQAKRTSLNKVPTQGADWQLIAQRGDVGPAGVGVTSVEYTGELLDGEDSTVLAVPTYLDSDILDVYLAGSLLSVSDYVSSFNTPNLTITFTDAPFNIGADIEVKVKQIIGK